MALADLPSNLREYPAPGNVRLLRQMWLKAGEPGSRLPVLALILRQVTAAEPLAGHLGHRVSKAPSPVTVPIWPSASGEIGTGSEHLLSACSAPLPDRGGSIRDTNIPRSPPIRPLGGASPAPSRMPTLEVVKRDRQGLLGDAADYRRRDRVADRDTQHGARGNRDLPEPRKR